MDGILERPLAQIADEQDLFAEAELEKNRWKPIFPASLCPQCGWNLKEGSGSHFDPHLLDKFISIAEPLYGRLSGHDDDVPKNDLAIDHDLFLKLDPFIFSQITGA